MLHSLSETVKEKKMLGCQISITFSFYCFMDCKKWEQHLPFYYYQSHSNTIVCLVYKRNKDKKVNYYLKGFFFLKKIKILKVKVEHLPSISRGSGGEN